MAPITLFSVYVLLGLAAFFIICVAYQKIKNK